VFGLYTGGYKVVTSPAAYNDGQWHYVVTTLSSAGQNLYVDGALVAHNAAVTTGQSYTGYWHVGGDHISTSWPDHPTSSFLNGTIDEFAVYPTALTASQIGAHYTASGR